MPAVPLQSSAIASIDYDDKTRSLNVTFTSGRTYTHDNVPPDIVDRFTKTLSPGRFYLNEVKGIY
jgi:hypothetical protein